MIIKTELNQDKINNNCINVEIIENNNHVKKTISFEDYVNSIYKLSNRITTKQIKVDCSNIINLKIRSKDDIVVLFEIPSFELFLIHNNKPTFWNLPTVICECSTKGDLKFWCIKTKKLTSKSKLYVLNLPHHYNDGGVCYGSFVRKKVAPNVEEMTKYAFEYLQTTSTHQTTVNLIPNGDNCFKYVIGKNEKGKLISEI